MGFKYGIFKTCSRPEYLYGSNVANQKYLSISLKTLKLHIYSVRDMRINMCKCNQLRNTIILYNVFSQFCLRTLLNHHIFNYVALYFVFKYESRSIIVTNCLATLSKYFELYLYRTSHLLTSYFHVYNVHPRVRLIPEWSDLKASVRPFFFTPFRRLHI